MKHLILILAVSFLVRVKVPWGVDVTYKGVQNYTLGAYGHYWELTLSDGRKAIVPTFWATIEEEQEKK